MADMDAPRLMVREPCDEKVSCNKGMNHNWGVVGPAEHTRATNERDIDLVVAWLREQGAVDSEAALNVLIQEDLNQARGITMTTVRKAIDAALSPTSQEGEPKEAENG